MHEHAWEGMLLPFEVGEGIQLRPTLPEVLLVLLVRSEVGPQFGASIAASTFTGPIVPEERGEEEL